MILHIYTDWGSRWNPWDAWVWVLILDGNHSPLEKRYKYLWITTNNIAEYTAVLLGLKRWIELWWKEMYFYLDSKLAVSQLSWEWKVKNDGIRNIYNEILSDIKSSGVKVSFNWIPREKNKEADRLANTAMDKKNNNT